MSRIDDERQAALVAEKLALQKRQEEDRAKESRQKSVAFSQLVNQQSQTKTEGEKRQSVLKAAFEQAQARTRSDKQLAPELERRAALQTRQLGELESAANESRSTERRHASSVDVRRASAQGAEGERAASGLAADQAAAGMARASRGNDSIALELGAQGRRDDQERGRDGLAQKAESALKGNGAQGAGSPFADGLDADPDKGGGGSDAKGGDSKKDDVPQTFRLNPALMAPVPVAQPKTTPSSDKLRALANEIAQKIVERVRVGKNAAGKSEFQIDLKSTVLKGLSIKVSGGNGRISAVFSGSDREVMKMLRDQEQSLRQALSGRGLALTEFRLEVRA